MRVLFLFMDGVGLGKDDPSINPFSSAPYPTIKSLLSGRKLIDQSVPFYSKDCTLLGLDARLGVPGTPQSATNQATILTGLNFPELLGYHYGPKPNAEIKMYFKQGIMPKSPSTSWIPEINLSNNSIFAKLIQSDHKVASLNAYPEKYFDHVNSGKRNHSVIPLALTSAGFSLFDQNDLFQGKAISADFTGQGWHDYLDLPQTPILSPYQTGKRIASLSENYDLSVVEFWESDHIGHKQDFEKATKMIEKLDFVIKGLIDTWNFEKGMILISSDHGNLEDLSTRKHTLNNVPAFLIGNSDCQQLFSEKVLSICDLAPFMHEIIVRSKFDNLSQGQIPK